jgi:WhiB family transcriptional regulator, redox-sensing transcriptional regulator
MDRGQRRVHTVIGLPGSGVAARPRGGETVSRPGSGSALVLPGLPRGLMLPSLPGALCKGQDPRLWFPGTPGQPGQLSGAVRRAKALCAACPARAQCLEWAIKANEAEGVWGGTTPAERAAIRRLPGGGGE